MEKQFIEYSKTYFPRIAVLFSGERSAIQSATNYKLLSSMEALGLCSAQNGGILVFEDIQYHCQVACRIEILSSDRFLLALVDNPYSRLHLFDDNAVFKSVASPNKNCILFARRHVHNQSVIMLHTQVQQGSVHVMKMLPTGSLSSSKSTVDCLDHPNTLKDVLFQVREMAMETSIAPNVRPRRCWMPWDMRDFAIHGFSLQRKAIPMSKIDECNRLLLHHQGQVGCLIPGAVQGGNYGKFPGAFSQNSIVRSVLHEDVKVLIRDLLGGAIDQENNLSVQIAFRYPQLESESISEQRNNWGKQVNE